MSSPQDDGTPPAPWVSPSARPAEGSGAPQPDASAGPTPPAPAAGPPAADAPHPAAAVPAPGPGAGAPGWGAPAAPPGWGVPPAAGAPVPPGSPYGAWRPAPLQPGIVPLRPLGLGEILDGSVRAVRANPSVMFGLAALVVTVAVALQTLVQLYLVALAAGAIGDAVVGVDGGADVAAATEMLSVGFAGSATGPLLLPVTSVLTGLLIVSVSRSVLGRRVALREVVRSRRVWWVLGFTLLLMLAEALAFAAWLGLAVLLFAQEQEGAAVAVLLGGGLLLLVALVWVTVRTLLVPPALMLEGKPFWATVARAWRLTRGSFWRLLGTYLLASILVVLVSYLFLLPASAVGGVLMGLGGSATVTIVLTALGTVVGMTISTSFLAAVVALLYVDVRMRREGLDLELARAASGP
ncbi:MULTISPECIES: glycerophosphoryl diester phosphodiesterase membrane domain-containing protein [Cellulomonas]|uniref:glycerophosphoryl diester phosphodiesterase membrane domain-containing protein n=1 Tax=Cellulomonas TaxID=1707 RepID=UPI0010A88CB2|nr:MULTISPECIES: glycerophosphoryl diester phosphodiesterase membrane domain-containing protein [Cellulomonas]